MSISNNRIRAHDELCRLQAIGRALICQLVCKPPYESIVMADTVGEMPICSKLGPNLSEMEFSLFVRIQKVIWDHLLASKAVIIQK